MQLVQPKTLSNWKKKHCGGHDHIPSSHPTASQPQHPPLHPSMAPSPAGPTSLPSGTGLQKELTEPRVHLQGAPSKGGSFLAQTTRSLLAEGSQRAGLALTMVRTAWLRLLYSFDVGSSRLWLKFLFRMRKDSGTRRSSWTTVGGRAAALLGLGPPLLPSTAMGVLLCAVLP